MADPLVVIVIDELAALTAYVGDRELKKRAEAALQLLSQGRAPVVLAVVALQDRGKDVLPFRDLFPSRIALRLLEDTQIAYRPSASRSSRSTGRRWGPRAGRRTRAGLLHDQRHGTARHWTRRTCAGRSGRCARRPAWTPTNGRPQDEALLRLPNERGRRAPGAIARMVGHSSTKVTKLVYRKQLRPVLTDGTAVMETLFELPAPGPKVLAG